MTFLMVSLPLQENDTLAFQEMALVHQICFPHDPWSETALKALCYDPRIIGSCALKDGKIIGFLLCRFIADEAEVMTLCVSPPYQGQGIAGDLWTAVKPCLRAHSIKTLFLEVAVNNERAKRLYHKLGFTAFGVRKNYYASYTPNGQRILEDAITYRLELDIF